jgi:hypothetical protein
MRKALQQRNKAMQLGEEPLAYLTFNYLLEGQYAPGRIWCKKQYSLTPNKLSRLNYSEIWATTRKTELAKPRASRFPIFPLVLNQMRSMNYLKPI